jgi:uncharacterized protein with PIN domain
MIGYDSTDRDGASWWAAFARARQSGQIILTLLKTLRHPPDATIWVLNSENSNEQVQEVLKRIPIEAPPPEPFSRCLVCNVTINDIPADDARKQVPPMVAQQQSIFYQCPKCHRIYWPGSHYHKMVSWMKRWEIYEKLGLPQWKP